MTPPEGCLQLPRGGTVVIVGGGPGGSSCALKLLLESARSGLDLRVIVVEPKDFEVHFNACAGVLSPPFQEILARELDLTLPAELLKRRIFGYRLHSGPRDIFLTGSGPEEPTFTVRRSELDAFLLEKAREMGAEIVRSRVTGLEFVRTPEVDEVRVYSDSGYLRADLVVGAFGAEESSLRLWEDASRRVGGYRRPSAYLTSFLTKIPASPRFLERNLGHAIFAFLQPRGLGGVEFGAVTPKRGYALVNIAGTRVSSVALDRFLRLPEVRQYLPPFEPEDLEFYRGAFPTAPARNPYGRRYVTVGDATGWLRPFKGKGINTAVLTGVRAARTAVRVGIDRRAFASYADECRDLLSDYWYGVFVRAACLVAGPLFLGPMIGWARVDPHIYAALYNSVSGHESFRDIITDMFRTLDLQRLGAAVLPGRRKKLDIQIRLLEPRDIDALKELDELITGRPQIRFWDSQAADFLAREPGACLGAEVGGKLVGFIMGYVRGWRFGSDLCGWLEVVGTHPEYRGQGIARLLTEAQIEHFRSVGVKSLECMIDWNEPGLVDYLRSLGFERGESINLKRPIVRTDSPPAEPAEEPPSHPLRRATDPPEEPT